MFLDILFYLFLSSLFLQVFYYLFSYSQLTFYKPKDKRAKEEIQMPGHEPITVVICAHNEEQNLRELLPMLYGQDYPDFEVLVIDDRSSDATHDFLKEEKLTEPRLKIVTIENTPEHINNKKYGLTLGIKTAKNDMLLLTDADCRPAGNQWIAQMAGRFREDTQIVLGYSPYQYKKGLLNAFIRYETLLTAIQYLSVALSGRPYMGVGRNLAYRKSFFLQSKGFNNHLKITGGDDDLFVNQNAGKKNTSICVGAESITRSVPKTNFDAYYLQKKRHLSVGKFYKASDKMKLSVFALSHVLTWFCFIILIVAWKEPYIVLGGFILKMAIQYTILSISLKKLGDKFNLAWLPFLDFCYVFYYITTGFTAFFSKNIKWS